MQKLIIIIMAEELNSLPKGYKYTHDNSNSNLLTFFCNELNTEAKMRQWVKKFGEESYVEWRIEQNSSHIKQVKCICKLKYRCQHGNSWYKTKLKSSSRIRKNVHCPATLLLRCLPKRAHQRIQTVTKIFWKNHHNHPVGMNEVTLKFRDVSETTCQTLRLLFSNGHSPKTAHHILLTDYFITYGYGVLRDRQQVPDLAYCYNRFYNEFIHKSRDIKKINYSKLEEKVNEIKTSGGYAKLHYVISDKCREIIFCVVTSLMLRIHKTVPQAAKVVFVETNEFEEKRKIYFLSTNTEVGNLPLGYIFTSDNSVTDIFSVFKSLDINGEFFYGMGHQGPQIIFTDVSSQSSLQNVWSRSIVSLNLNIRFKIIWDMLKKSSYDQNICIDLFNKFKNILLDTNPEDISTCENELMSSLGLARSQFYDLVTINAQELLIHKDNKNTYMEYVLRAVKDIFLKNLRNFNSLQLADFVLIRFDKLYINRIQYLLEDCLSYSKFKQMIPTDENLSFDLVNCLNDNQYLVKGIDSNNFVDFDINFCTCKIGITGSLCGHKSLIVLYKYRNLTNVSTVQASDTQQFKCNMENFLMEKSLIEEKMEIFGNNDDLDKNIKNSTDIQKLEDICNEIVLRVEDSQTEKMGTTIHNFCEDYKKYCTDDESLKNALNNFGKHLVCNK